MAHVGFLSVVVAVVVMVVVVRAERNEGKRKGTLEVSPRSLKLVVLAVRPTYDLGFMLGAALE